MTHRLQYSQQAPTITLCAPNDSAPHLADLHTRTQVNALGSRRKEQQAFQAVILWFDTFNHTHQQLIKVLGNVKSPRRYSVNAGLIV